MKTRSQFRLHQCAPGSAPTCCAASGVGEEVVERCGEEMPRKLASRRVRPRRVTSPGESGRSGSDPPPRGSVRLRFALRPRTRTDGERSNEAHQNHDSDGFAMPRRVTSRPWTP